MSLKENPLGIYEKALPPFRSWTEALDIVKRCGYDFLELSIDESDDRLGRLHWNAKEIKALRDAVVDTGIPIRTLCLSGHRKFPFASEDTGVRKHAWEILERALYLCRAVGIPIIQTQGHDVYYERSTEATWDRYRNALVTMAEAARNASVMIGIENADLPCVGSADQALSLIREVNNPWFRMYPDIGNFIAHGYDVQEQLKKVLPYTVAVHVKDARPGEFRRVSFGEGTVPFTDAFDLLDNARYRGPFVIEMWNEESPDPEAVIRNAREWVRDRMAR